MNNPDDGNYDLSLAIEALLPNGTTLPVGNDVVSFTGQSISFLDNFLEIYMACIAEFIGKQWAKSKAVLPKVWRTPEIAWKQFEEIAGRLDALATVKVFSADSVEIAKQRIAARLKLARE